MYRIITTLLTFICFSLGLNAQINFTANDQVPEYTGKFRFGINPGYHGSDWGDDQLADIAAGNSSLGIDGAGVEAFRATLPEEFLEQWGYDVEVDDFQHYESVGMADHVTFIGYPSDAHRDPTSHCPNHQSELFANMYLDIWDGGANGTPVNDDNYYALYVYRMVTTYQDYVKFWEIWNEPDFDYSGNAYKDPGEAGNWWDNVPEPCDMSIRAPIFEYIRMLRISYEVIKSIDPDAYVAVGGLGYPSFLDLIMRHTDNPVGGQANSEFPNTGGAYFDVMSYHSYPHIDGSLREWDNASGGFIYYRHSDAATNGVIQKQADFAQVLNTYGYNDQLYPSKKWIITESNTPGMAFDDDMGSDESQRNFIIKTRVACELNDILQFDLYALARKKSPADSDDGFDAMGLYHRLSDIVPSQEELTDEGIASQTMTELLADGTFDAAATASLNLPANIGGAAYMNTDNSYTFVLWAVTETDQSESAAATYSLPASMNIANLEKREWDFGQTGSVANISSTNISLTGAPVFLRGEEVDDPVNTSEQHSLSQTLDIFPNPTQQHFQLSVKGNETADFTIEVMNVIGKQIEQRQVVYAGTSTVYDFDCSAWAKGTYLVKLSSAEGVELRKVVVE